MVNFHSCHSLARVYQVRHAPKNMERPSLNARKHPISTRFPWSSHQILLSFGREKKLLGCPHGLLLFVPDSWRGKNLHSGYVAIKHDHLLWAFPSKMVVFPSKMVVFHSWATVYQRVQGPPKIACTPATICFPGLAPRLMTPPGSLIFHFSKNDDLDDWNHLRI